MDVCLPPSLASLASLASLVNAGQQTTSRQQSLGRDVAYAATISVPTSDLATSTKARMALET
jgi:hypothetical protein